MAFARTHHEPNGPLLSNLSLLLLSFPPPAHPYTPQDACQGLEDLEDHQARCSYLHTHPPCSPRGCIDYLRVFYCILAEYPLLGYLLLFLWLLLLFYLLGSTASRYFCSSLESLSRLLRLPPTIAGVTLLPLGNGAADVFAIFVSFAGSGISDVGLSSVLGSAFFVSSVVVGIISIGVASRAVVIDRSSFVRDLCFLAAALCSLLAFLIAGRIRVWCSICFVSLYIVYIVTVWIGLCCGENSAELAMPLLDSIQVVQVPIDNNAKETSEHDQVDDDKSCRSKLKPSVPCCIHGLIYLVQMPLHLPRRLTIPDVSEERWSKPFAVSAAIFAPLLLATLWNSQREEMGSDEWLTVYLSGGLVGIVLGIIAAETTEKHSPPKRCLFSWLAGGFLMSVIWAYMIARELVALLVSIGCILGIRPLVLGLTVLAWGNSLGDLMANVAIAANGGSDGVQIAFSGCYAGPLFNIVFGLGLSLVLASWASHPSPFVIPQDPSLFETMGFLVGALLWALAMLPRRGMKLDRVFGAGLLAIYLCFLCLRLSESLGLLQLRSLLLHL
ncbi:cation/calcium exchanger 1-like [Phoenix dactylifera]|uniref:Cation/calcium exchanger 1-like n=1 Tax=Phoenix dactylifera TaxID=42345 RepID=A0A8B8Z8Z1_PHODC|nr:cation/calcium exchanger 1-like [Phoenix dactylifera]